MESKEGVGGEPEEEPPTEGVESGEGQSLRWVEPYDGAGPVQAPGSRTGGWFFRSRPDQSNPEPRVWTWIPSSEAPGDGLGTCPGLLVVCCYNVDVNCKILNDSKIKRFFNSFFTDVFLALLWLKVQTWI